MIVVLLPDDPPETPGINVIVVLHRRSFYVTGFNSCRFTDATTKRHGIVN
jgi:hypothetical protein